MGASSLNTKSLCILAQVQERCGSSEFKHANPSVFWPDSMTSVGALDLNTISHCICVQVDETWGALSLNAQIPCIFARVEEKYGSFEFERTNPNIPRTVRELSI